MDTPEQDDNVEQRIEELRERGGDFIDTCELKSAYRLYSEVARLAKSEGRVIPYLLGVFHKMDIALSMLEPTRTREFALELIAYLESEEHARKLQPDMPEDEYEHTVHWMTACAYENLAEATGRTDGYNSEGMHACITDGIDVCRRTGKMACVRCFREYATEVYTAADDIPMALHHSRSISSHTGPWSNRGDRRWLGVKNEGWLMLLTGQLETTLDLLNRSLPMTREEDVGVKNQARLEVLGDLEQALLLAGQLDPLADARKYRSTSDDDPDKPLAKGEWPWLDLRHSMIDAVRACCAGDHLAAQKSLAPWDRWLTERKHLSDWFEVRLRLIAACRLAKQRDRSEKLAQQLAERARPSRDWLTLRRLSRLMDDSEPISPLALIAPLSVGPFASRVVQQDVPVAPPVEEPATTEEGEDHAPPPGLDEQPEEAPPPLDGVIIALADRLNEAEEDDDVREEMLQQLLDITPAQATHPFDAVRLVHMVRYLLGDCSRAEEIWRWAESIATPHPQEASILNHLAVLGDILRDNSDDAKELIPQDRIVSLFRTSLDLDPFNVRNHSQAGAYHLSVENLGEAERCLARGFRLERSNSFLAKRLAEVYRQTERPRDALAVLDMALREDADDPEVAQDAAMIAFNLEQWDGMLMYLDVYEGMNPDQEWNQYYRAVALMELDRPDDVLEAAEEEERRSPGRPWPVAVLRGCAYVMQGDLDKFREQVRAVLDMKLREVDYMTVTGITKMCERLWKAMGKLPADDPLRGALNERLLQAGIAPDDYFDMFRQRGEEREGVNFYRVEVKQPLDERWPTWPGCLSEQENWSSYTNLWGVLASDEEEAGERVVRWQARCYPLPATVVETELLNEDYTDKPGVVWQGVRSGEELEGYRTDDDDLDDDQDDDLDEDDLNEDDDDLEEEEDED